MNSTITTPPITTPPVILTIDDEKIIRDSFRYFLEDQGYPVLEAENGRIGLEIFHREHPDLVMVDLRMPEMDGLEVLATVTRVQPDTPIIIISGTGVLSDVVAALQLGAWDYLLKPVHDLNILQHAVVKALERAQLIKENRAYSTHLEEMVRIRTQQLEAANAELHNTRMEIIRRLGKAAEYKDNETGRHVIRVGLYSALLAQELGLPPHTVDLIRQCSPMHDLGKIGIPDYILLKPGLLDDHEWQIMHRHSQIGSTMLGPLPAEDLVLYQNHTTIGQDILDGSHSPLLDTAAKIAGCHHEHWDGTGYPHRLKGETIPIEARIVAVADVYDALSSKRSYKPSFPEEECWAIIKQLAGTVLDPRIVAIFFQHIKKIMAIKETWKD